MNTSRNLPTMAVALMIFGLSIVLFTTDGTKKVAARTPANDCWISYDSVGRPGTFQYLNGIAAISASDIWAVGETDHKTLTMHWDGIQWSMVSSPNTGAPINALTAVSGTSSNDVWAVGYGTAATINAGLGPLTMHWDGTQWSTVDNRAPGAINAVSALSPTDVWAVGDSGRGRNGGQPFIAHWNGSQWSYTKSDQLRTINYMQGVVALAPDNVWAVGSSILHWDGAKWKVVLPYSGNLYAIAASAPNDVWAVGTRGSWQSPTMHWDGKNWSNVSITADGSSWLVGVTAISPDNAWAVSEGGQVFHWDGRTWQGEDILPALPSHMFSAITNAGSNLWIAGYKTVSLTNISPQSGLMLRRPSTECVQPTPTPIPPPDPPAHVPGTGSKTFPETGQTVSGAS